jgi:hypothetical protein
VPIRRANSFCLMRALSREYFRANPSPKLLYLDARSQRAEYPSDGADQKVSQ